MILSCDRPRISRGADEPSVIVHHASGARHLTLDADKGYVAAGFVVRVPKVTHKSEPSQPPLNKESFSPRISASCAVLALSCSTALKLPCRVAPNRRSGGDADLLADSDTPACPGDQ